MRLIQVLLTLMVTFYLSACAKGAGTGFCSTKLMYVTNPYTSGEQAIRHASEYRAHVFTGTNDFMVTAIVDTASANLVINEKSYAFGDETLTGEKSYDFDNGSEKSIAITAKDNFDIACVSDFAARFALTSKDAQTANVLGLAFSDPERHPHERRSPAFIDQLVKEIGFNNVFSLALCGQRGNSRILLGGIDAGMKKFMRSFIPIIEKTAYVVPALSIRLTDNKKIIGNFPDYDPKTKKGIRTIIDSASSFVLLPINLATKVAKIIKDDAQALGHGNFFPDGYFRTERANSTKTIRFSSLAQIRQFPSLEITFMGFDKKIKALELSPLHYFKEMDLKDPLVRAFGIRETGGDVVLGQPFLENHYTYFDRKNKRIGFGNIDLACTK
jgi:hypothetical protein